MEVFLGKAFDDAAEGFVVIGGIVFEEYFVSGYGFCIYNFVGGEVFDGCDVEEEVCHFVFEGDVGVDNYGVCGNGGKLSLSDIAS